MTQDNDPKQVRPMTFGSIRFTKWREDVPNLTTTMVTLMKPTKKIYKVNPMLVNAMVPSVYNASRRRLSAENSTPAKMKRSENAIPRMCQKLVKAVHTVAWTGQEPLPIARPERVTTSIRRNIQARHHQETRTTKEEVRQDQ